MGLMDVIRIIPDLANELTSDMQVTVQHFSYLGQNDDGYGGPKYPDQPVMRQALVDERILQIRTPDGDTVKSRALISFFGPVVVTPLDRIILPDGTTGPILAVNLNGSVLDPQTGRSIMTEVYLGWS